MAAAYAAVVSVLHLVEQIQLYHARHPIFLDEQQRQLESLHENVVRLQDFLESYSNEDSNEVQDLKSRITDAAYAAEDIIESLIVDDIHSRSIGSSRLPQGLKKMKDFITRGAMKVMENSRLTDHHVGRSSSHFSEGLRKVIEDMKLIKKEIAKITEESKRKDQQSRDQADGISLRRSSNLMDIVVVFEDDLNQIMEKLTQNQYNLQIIPIIGMGGIGKTTLAKNVYVNPFIVQHFDIRGWLTISQEYDMRKIMLGLLQEIGDSTNQKELENLQHHQLGEKLHKYLSGRRYLIVMDDMWSIRAWDELRIFLPDYKNKSRIIVTTRLSNVADCFSSLDPYKLNLLDESKSWNLFCRKVFVQESCPPELEEIGKHIAKSCKGLPLAISVIGGLLAKSNMTREYWKYVADDINTIVTLEDDARCLKILSLSYKHLPAYLKPCFLYLGIFPEDHEIRVSKLIKLWMAEGFLGPSKPKSLEEVAENYLEDLVDRNLVFVSKWGSIGNMKYCKIHDLLRDLCLREAKNEKFLCVNMMQNPNISLDLNSQRRIVIHQYFSGEQYSFEVSRALWSASLARSLTCNFHLSAVPLTLNLVNFRLPLNFRLLRMLDVVDDYDIEDILQLVNSRYLSFRISLNIFTESFRIPSSICLFWNLQTLIIDTLFGLTLIAPSEIWEMPQLRHVMIPELLLPNPLGGQNDRVLENLQTISESLDLRWTEEILRKIPIIKKLKLKYRDYANLISCRLNNLGRLHELQSLVCKFPINWSRRDELIHNLEFPFSLKKLSLFDVYLSWEDITTKVGSLPNLEKLRLINCHVGKEWNSVDGQFRRLKFLEISCANYLVYWRAEETHFPCLEHLVLHGLTKLEEIPPGIGDIPTLQSIRLKDCSRSAANSAKKILEEQKELGNENLRFSLQGINVEYHKDYIDEDDEEEEEETRDD